MTNPSTSILATFGFLLVLLSCACDPCDDPGTIEIDYSDRSGPEMYWQVVTQSMTPSGPASSLSLIYSLDEVITMAADETVEITLMATDDQSGISFLNIIGGFGYTCGNTGQAISLHGSIPGSFVYYDFGEGVCAYQDGAYPVFIINGSGLCSGDYPDVVSGGYELNGYAGNSNDLTSQNRLVVNIIGGGEI